MDYVQGTGIMVLVSISYLLLFIIQAKKKKETKGGRSVQATCKRGEEVGQKNSEIFNLGDYLPGARRKTKQKMKLKRDVSITS